MTNRMCFLSTKKNKNHYIIFFLKGITYILKKESIILRNNDLNIRYFPNHLKRDKPILPIL